ncbi:hypothetical protein QVD17_05154 [Tagetes erecta]|uniref:Uncharacterized protein n=1 Tax=Tagetes erecta TaxID=13708 RepID=A0AAD8PAA9_TARER|nr:hypothetical protein QVD17_05154 [Tagetes erecta]
MLSSSPTKEWFGLILRQQQTRNLNASRNLTIMETTQQEMDTKIMNLIHLKVLCGYVVMLRIQDYALPNLFKKYMCAGVDTTWKHDGTGLRLAISKQLVMFSGFNSFACELNKMETLIAVETLFACYIAVKCMNLILYSSWFLLPVDLSQVELVRGHITVSSKEHCGSTFSIVLPHKVSNPI